MKKVNLIVVSIILMSSRIIMANDYIHPDVEQAISDQWSLNNEGILEKAILAVPRAVARTAYEGVLKSKTSQRVINTGRAGADASIAGVIALTGSNWIAGERIEKAYVEAGESVVNVLSTTESLIDDAGNLVKQPFYFFAKSSPRIKLCTNNLSYPAGAEELALVMPAKHVGVIVDNGIRRLNGSGGGDVMETDRDNGVMCHEVPILNNLSESLAIENLLCGNDNFRGGYDFFFYNCGANAKDALKLAGLGFPGFMNAGIGNEFGGQVFTARGARRFEEGKRAKLVCAEHVKSIIATINAIELGRDIEKMNFGLYHDTRLQIAVSAARSKFDKHRKLAGREVEISIYLNDSSGFAEGVLPTLVNIFQHLDNKALSRLHPNVQVLYRRLAKYLNVNIEKGEVVTIDALIKRHAKTAQSHHTDYQIDEQNDRNGIGSDFTFSADALVNLDLGMQEGGSANLRSKDSLLRLSASFSNIIKASIALKLDADTNGNSKDKVIDLKDLLKEANIVIRNINGVPVAVVIGKQPMAFGQGFDGMIRPDQNSMRDMLRKEKVVGFTVALDKRMLYGILDSVEVSAFNSNKDSLNIGDLDGYSVRVKKNLSTNTQATFSHLKANNDKRTAIGLIWSNGEMTAWVEGVRIENMDGKTQAVTAGVMKELDNIGDLKNRIVAEITWVKDLFVEVGVGYEIQFTDNFKVGAELRRRQEEGKDNPDYNFGIRGTYKTGATVRPDGSLLFKD
jgi:hypothetical protein